VIDEGGAVLGLVVEEGEFDGMNYGPSTYAVADNPGLVAYASRWRSEGHRTPAAALEALVDRDVSAPDVMGDYLRAGWEIDAEGHWKSPRHPVATTRYPRMRNRG
jgi:hypothetical protein